jgi:hypothetical protein
MNGKTAKKIICKKCGTEIRGAKPEEQFTKAEIRTFKAIIKIKAKHPDWSNDQCFAELSSKRLYSGFMKWLKKQQKKLER